MSLPADPSVTYNAQGNVLNAVSVANGTPNTGNICDFSTSTLGGWISVFCASGTASATNGIQVQIFPAGDSTPHYDTVSLPAATIAQTSSQSAQQSFLVPTGKYSVTLTNFDASHAVTCSITANPIT